MQRQNTRVQIDPSFHCWDQQHIFCSPSMPCLQINQDWVLPLLRIHCNRMRISMYIPHIWNQHLTNIASSRMPWYCHVLQSPWNIGGYLLLLFPTCDASARFSSAPAVGLQKSFQAFPLLQLPHYGPLLSHSQKHYDAYCYNLPYRNCFFPSLLHSALLQTRDALLSWDHVSAPAPSLHVSEWAFSVY